MRSDAPRRQPMWHAPPPCQRACPARCSEPAAAADQASGQPDQRTYREASPHPAAAWRLARAHRPARTRSWQAGQAAALVELAPGAAGRRARAVPGDHRVPECAAPPTDGSRRGGTPLRLTRAMYGHAWAPQPSACQAYRLPGRAALQAPRLRTSADLHTLARIAYRVAPPHHVPPSKLLTSSQASVRARRFQGLLAAACLAATWRGAKRPSVQE